MKIKNKISIGAIILTRYDSSRLPGKALKYLDCKPLIQWPIDALQKIANIKVIIATTFRSVDDPIIDFAKKKNVLYYRGETNDIAKRVINCAKRFKLDYVFRINGDSPFLNNLLLEKAIEMVKSNSYDFVTNLINRTYPYGLSCELIKVKTFQKKYKEFDDFQKEHITNFYYKNLKGITFTSLRELPKDYSKIDWAIDTSADLERINNYLKFTNLKHFEILDIEEFIHNYQTIINNKNQ